MAEVVIGARVSITRIVDATVQDGEELDAREAAAFEDLGFILLEVRNATLAAEVEGVVTQSATRGRCLDDERGAADDAIGSVALSATRLSLHHRTGRRLRPSGRAPFESCIDGLVGCVCGSRIRSRTGFVIGTAMAGREYRTHRPVRKSTAFHVEMPTRIECCAQSGCTAGCQPNALQHAVKPIVLLGLIDSVDAALAHASARLEWTARFPRGRAELRIR
jgi:hypothetical protein